MIGVKEYTSIDYFGQLPGLLSYHKRLKQNISESSCQTLYLEKLTKNLVVAFTALSLCVIERPHLPITSKFTVFTIMSWYDFRWGVIRRQIVHSEAVIPVSTREYVITIHTNS